MDKQEFYAQLDRLGLCTQDALERFMGNEELFLSFVCQLPEKLNLSRIRQALDQEDEESFYLSIHSLKGLAGNMSIRPVCDCAQAISVEFQSSQFLHKKKLAALVYEAERECQAISALVNQYLSEVEVP